MHDDCLQTPDIQIAPCISRTPFIIDLDFSGAKGTLPSSSFICVIYNTRYTYDRRTGGQSYRHNLDYLHQSSLRKALKDQITNGATRFQSLDRVLSIGSPSRIKTSTSIKSCAYELLAAWTCYLF